MKTCIWHDLTFMTPVSPCPEKVMFYSRPFVSDYDFLKFILTFFNILIIINQIFLLEHDWSKHVTWPNIPQLRLGHIREYSPVKVSVIFTMESWKMWKLISLGKWQNQLFVFDYYCYNVNERSISLRYYILALAPLISVVLLYWATFQ